VLNRADLVDLLILAGFLLLTGLLLCIWIEIRRLRMTLEIFLLSSKENSRSLMATILEVNASSAARDSESKNREKRW
jgi:hypothetical protein